MRRIRRLALAGAAALACGRAARLSRRGEPPAFLLQDARGDGLCLAGAAFGRCGLDTLWYVTGAPGAYEIHARPADGAPGGDDDRCLGRASCDLPRSALRVAACRHCGARRWNVLGDAEAGYVLTTRGPAADAPEHCVVREGRAAAAAARNATGGEERCALLDLRFASAADLAAMGGDGARLGAAAAAGAVDEVEALVAAGAAVDARDWDGRTALGARGGS